MRNIPLFFRDATTFSALPSNQSYRPLVSTLLAIDYWLGGGLQPFWFHVSIFALFVALTLLLAFVIYRILENVAPSSANLWIAGAAAACCGLHPANAATVNYIISSSEVISTLGVVASFAVYFAFPNLRRYYVYTLPAGIAILTKAPRGYVRSPSGAFTTFDAPGAGTGQFQGTEGEGINPQETVSGYDIDTGGVAHGYVWAKDGTITTFDAPGSTGTLATAINPSGVITGAFSDTNGVTHGFLRIP